MFDELYPEQQQNTYRFTALNGLPPEPVKEPGAFAGFGRTVATSFAQGGAIAARGLSILGGALIHPFDREDAIARGDRQALQNLDAGGTGPLQDRYFSAADAITLPAVNYWKPNPANTGTASQIAGGFARMLLPLAAGGGNPSLVVAGEQVNAYDELTAQGVDGKTANRAAAVRGATTAAGMMLPAALVPGKLAAAGVGAVTNTALGITDRTATKLILENADYTKIAAQYKPLDGTQMAIDALIGGVTGAVAGKSRVTPEQLASAMVLNETHAMQDASLVAQDHPAVSTREVDAQRVAEDQINRGEQVSVAHEIPTDPVLVQEAQSRTNERLLTEVTITDQSARAMPADDLAVLFKDAREAYKTDKSLRMRQNWQTLSNETLRRTAEDMQKPAEQAPAQTVEATPAPPAPAPTAQPGKINIDAPAGKEAGQQAAPLDPIAQMVADKPDRMIRMEDGTEVRAADALAHADAGIAQAETDQHAYTAAVNCFISFGGSS